MNKGLFGNNTADKYKSGEVVFSAKNPGKGFVALNGTARKSYERGIDKNFGEKLLKDGYGSPVWTTQTSNFGTTNITSVAYGNNLWVAGGLFGQIRTSTDAVTWTTRTSNFSVNSTSIQLAYGNGVFAALGPTQSSGIAVRTSTDGVTWTTRGSDLSASGGPIRLKYIGNRFVGTYGTSNTITSTDGVTWTTSSYSFTAEGSGIAYGAGIWVIATNSFVYTSTNAVTWTPIGNQASYYAGYDVMYKNNKWIFINAAYGSRYITSLDTKFWVTETTKTTTINTRFIEVPGVSCAYAFSNGVQSPSIMRSLDGINWSKVGSLPGVVINGIATDDRNGIWVAVGQSGVLLTANMRSNYALPLLESGWVKS